MKITIGNFLDKGLESGNSDVWYDDRFLGDEYAVFVKVEKCGFWQQITPWYCRVGNAVRRMTKISQEENNYD